MRDRREELLARLEVILPVVQMTPGIRYFGRNKAGVPDDKRPGIILLDSDETPVNRYEQAPRGLGVAPQLVAMQPQIFYLAGDLPENTEIGTHLNMARIVIMDAILHDAELRAICSRNGYIVYGGMATDMKSGSTIEGECQINPVFVYPFISSELRQGE